MGSAGPPNPGAECERASPYNEAIECEKSSSTTSVACFSANRKKALIVRWEEEDDCYELAIKSLKENDTRRY